MALAFVITSYSIHYTKLYDILGGVLLLLQHGSYPVALVIFVASVVVPIAKMLALLWLCWTVHRGGAQHRHGRTRLYRLTEFV